MSYHQNNIHWKLVRLSKLAQGSSLFNAKPLWKNVPKGARVYNAFSNAAKFNYCRRRRQGYLLNFDLDAAQVLCRDITPARPRLDSLEEHWLRGRLWQPLTIEAEATETGWVITKSPDCTVAHFLIDKGVAAIRVQVFEAEDLPATKEKLALFDKGITGLQGTHPASLNAENTY